MQEKEEEMWKKSEFFPGKKSQNWYFDHPPNPTIPSWDFFLSPFLIPQTISGSQGFGGELDGGGRRRVLSIYLNIFGIWAQKTENVFNLKD